MIGKRTVRITIERDRVWIIRQCGSLAQSWCDKCGGEVEFVSLEQASALTRITPVEIEHSVLAAKLHASLRDGKVMRICLRSLLESVPVLKGFDEPQTS